MVCDYDFYCNKEVYNNDQIIVNSIIKNGFDVNKEFDEFTLNSIMDISKYESIKTKKLYSKQYKNCTIKKCHRFITRFNLCKEHLSKKTQMVEVYCSVSGCKNIKHIYQNKLSKKNANFRFISYDIAKNTINFNKCFDSYCYIHRKLLKSNKLFT